MIKNAIKILFLCMIVCFGVGGCKKQDDYLNAKKNNYDVILSTVSDYQALMDNNGVMNANYPTIGLVGSDNYYVTATEYNALTVPQSTAYNWQVDIWQGLQGSDWTFAYERMEYANIALDGLAAIGDSAGSSAYNNVKGSALFYRAMDLYNVASTFCLPYSASSANTDLGIPVRTTSDVNVKATRATVAATYNQIIADLKAAIPLLPNLPAYNTRPSAAAALALLAKVYLSMEDYSDALTYSSAALNLDSTLIDFNNTSIVNPGARRPFPANTLINPEVLYYATGIGYSLTESTGKGIPDTILYNSYNLNDLRRSTFYRTAGGQLQFHGSYTNNSYNFSGIGINEVLLIRAECNARLSNGSAAVSDINYLLSNRYITGTYVPLTDTSGIVDTVLNERRMELPFTGFVRWEDLRRLNKDPKYAYTLIRVINGTTYTLPPEDPRYVYPIPDNEIQVSGIQQNQR